ncbi:hypothetical protein Pint_35209 [Pistacia integerrima]|uniref:Uncharacterized protein n=1 Tax=Pistacia integerrima TaxID=434235 RepID=A0ACC0Y1G6_9ROSI|nr:hypothetical protein Pint_35209 [Pistacia integerrima]
MGRKFIEDSMDDVKISVCRSIGKKHRTIQVSQPCQRLSLLFAIEKQGVLLKLHCIKNSTSRRKMNQ